MFLKYMDVLISEYPIIKEYYIAVTEVLLKQKRYDDSYRYFKMYHEISPNAYNSKWMGIIALSHKNYKEALVDLSESLKYNDNDEQVYYNLAGAYVMKKDYKKARELVVKALSIKPNYREARSLLEQLNSVLKRR
jgi:tetratricopeptide (TPR) repeat protein